MNDAQYRHGASETNRDICRIGGLALGGCMFAALLLVLAHFDAIELPGCGTASDCTRAAASRWGKLPGTDWPLSFVGFAYFQALVAAFIYGGGRLPALLRAVVAVGAAVSAILTAVMFAEGYVCGYCLAIHVLNIAFALGYESFQRPAAQHLLASSNSLATMATFATTVVASFLLLAVVDHRVALSTTQARAEQLQKALEKASGAALGEARKKISFDPGRYLLGPKSAPIHIVVVSDYQCPSCRTIDAQLREIVTGRNDISISARHFPFCTDCNEHIDKTRHPNACRAALAAEAAGIVGGADAFWRMHDWLFERGGEFTDEELLTFVADLPIDQAAFRQALASEATVSFIRSDAAAANAAGIRFTPMIFINGAPIELNR